jgi:cell shape-determining protein MreC
MYLSTAFKSRLGDALSPEISQPEARRLKQEHEALINRIGALERAVRQRERLLKDLQNFRGMYGPRRRFPWELIPARVVMMDALPYGATRVINVGRAEGIEPGVKATERIILTDRSKALLQEKLATVTGSALVGRVVESSAYTARLQLVTDRGFQIKGRIIRDVGNPRTITDMPAGVRVALSGENATLDVEAQGDGAGGLVVQNVKEYENVLPGDVLVTRDEDYYLPAQVSIGTVTDVEKYPDSPGFVTLRVRPQVNLGRLRYVYIVVPLGSE